MTLNEIAYNIKNIVEGGVHGEDSNISLRQIKAMIHYHRGQLLYKITNDGKNFSERMISHYRATITNAWMPMPQILGFTNNRALISITLENEDALPSKDVNLSMGTIVPFYTEEESQFHINSRFAPSSDKIYAVIDGSASRLRFFKGVDSYGGGVMMLKYIAAKPADGNMEYPLPPELISTLVTSILSTEFKMMLSVGDDVVNDSRNLKSGQQKKGTSDSEKRKKLNELLSD
jgi:hypothetical protein